MADEEPNVSENELGDWRPYNLYVQMFRRVVAEGIKRKDDASQVYKQRTMEHVERMRTALDILTGERLPPTVSEPTVGPRRVRRRTIRPKTPTRKSDRTEGKVEIYCWWCSGWSRQGSSG